MISCSFELPNEKSINISFEDNKGYVEALRTIALGILELPQDELLDMIENYNEDLPVLERIACVISEALTPYAFEDWIPLIQALPWLFDTYVYPIDGNTNAQGALSSALRESIKSELMEDWDDSKAIAAHKPFEKEVIDPYAHLQTSAHWKQAYLALADYNERATIRYVAEKRGIETVEWPIAEELRERYRAYRKKGVMGWEGFALRREAQTHSIDTSDWVS